MSNQSNPINRFSVAYFPSQEYGYSRDREISLYVHTFTQDVHQNIMPIGGSSSSRPNFSIELDPQNAELEEKIITLFFSSEHHHQRDDLTRTISDFIEDTGWRLSFWSTLSFELVQVEGIDFEEIGTSADPNTKSKTLIRLSHIPGKVIRLGSIYVQVIPRSDWKTLNKRFVAIPASKVWTLNLPRSLGRAKQHKRLLGVLERHSVSIPDFVLASLKTHATNTPFSQNEFHRGQAWEIVRETARWGWHTGMWDEFSLEYFQIYRRLRFALAMALLREHILTQMNALLARLGFASRLTIVGLPSVSEIQEDISRMYQGELNFDDAMKSINLL